MLGRLKRGIRERLGIAGVNARVEELRDELYATMSEVDRRHIADGRHRQDQIDRLQTDLGRWRAVLATSFWTRQAPLRHEPTISVILPTRDRAALVGDGVRSVLAQSYHRWELVVVDDGSTDDTPGVLDRLLAGEPRATVVRTEGAGAGAARNAGLEVATGEWIAFLDDDNVMDPDWLRSVAEYTGRTPDCRAMHGAQLREDVLGGDVVPWMLFEPVPDLDRLKQHNTIDLGMLAVRADHPELRFDPSRSLYIDWEMVVRVMAHSPIHAVPALSGCYTLRARSRITDQHDDDTLADMQRELGR